jgi:FAD/FMN-containing dehydrogenase
VLKTLFFIIKIATMESNTASEVLSKSLIADLRTLITGRVVEPAEADYDQVRKVWNGMIDRRPALIIQCQSAQDIITAVRLAQEKNLVLSVRGGGHNVAGSAVCDGGIMIDLSTMRRVQVDPEQLTVKAQGGATWGDVDQATQAFGLATPGGIISSTGIAGLTLGGGVGWLVRHFGMSCDNLVEAEMVTAGGELVKASTSENPALFWGLRGGGGNFGIVTSFTYRLYPVSAVLGGMILHPIEDAKKVLQFYRQFMQTAPKELTLYVGLVHTPEGIPVIAFIGCYSGDLKEGEAVMKPLREFGSPMADMVQAQAFVQMQTMLDAAFPHGYRYYWKSGFLEALSDEAIDTIIHHARAGTSPFSSVVLEFYGGAAAQEPLGGTAFPHRQEQFNLVIVSCWQQPEEDGNHIHWARAFWQAMLPYFSHRVYVNYVQVLGVEGEEKLREGYGEHYDRLLALKRKYDPQNVFRLNQNINPAEQQAVV